MVEDLELAVGLGEANGVSMLIIADVLDQYREGCPLALGPTTFHLV